MDNSVTRILGVLLGVCAIGDVARADQCLGVDADAAAAAFRLLARGPVLTYCEPCREPPPTTAPTMSPRVTRHAATFDPTLSTIQLDGKDVDLAYVYVQTGKTTWTNVGLMVGCGARDVTGFVAIGGPPSAPVLSPVATFQKQLDDVDRKIATTIDTFAHAQLADRKVWQTELDSLRKQRAQILYQLAFAKDVAAKAARDKALQMSKECRDNPLAKGC